MVLLRDNHLHRGRPMLRLLLSAGDLRPQTLGLEARQAHQGNW